jgi:hypothetical protein
MILNNHFRSQYYPDPAEELDKINNGCLTVNIFWAAIASKVLLHVFR